jgi:GTP-binding protein
MLTLAIVGRPNVGKSTLYNRLLGSKQAIVHDQAGVTRDRHYGTGSIGDVSFTIIDTPGLEDLGKPTLAGRMSAQSMVALQEADIVLFVIDARAGVMGEDERFARELRKASKPIILVANKAEAMKKVEDNLLEALRLGFGQPVPFSAEHGEGMSLLYDMLCEHLPEAHAENTPPPRNEKPISIAIIGRPNAGKSTLLNSLLGEDRVLVGEEAGITRDAITIPFSYNGQSLSLVDTAGLRRKANIAHDLEQLSVQSSLHALKYAEIVVLVLDATIPLEKQDTTLAGLIEREGRACVIALNKADKITIDAEYRNAFDYYLHHTVPQMKGVPVVPMSALHNEGVRDILDAALLQYERWNKRISTSQLNQWLMANIEHHSPPLVSGRRLKFRYMTQIKTRPPTFVLFANKTEKDVPESYLRYLINNMRQAFDLDGVPLRLQLRTSKNPYVEK